MKIRLYKNAKLPEYATEGSAGFDLEVHNFKSFYTNRVNPNAPNELEVLTGFDEHILMPPMSRALVGCGFEVAVPKDCVLDIRSRSGKTLKEGLIVLNAPGTIDSDYRGEVGIILCNNSEFVIKVSIGDKVAQAVLLPCKQVAFEVEEDLDETKRGSGGFGHTGN